jgi:hypothetical protein
MARFLIEVPHDGTMAACTRAVEAFLRAGSHFVTHADWGCQDGDHRAWVVLELIVVMKPVTLSLPSSKRRRR